MKTVIPFSFDVFNGDELIAQDTILYNISDDNLMKVAEEMDNNGGHPVELCALEDLTRILYEQIYTEQLIDNLPEDMNLDNIEVKLQDNMPKELIAAADHFVNMKIVTIPYYVEVNGAVIRKEVKAGIPTDDFRAMCETVLSEKTDKPDYEIMAELFPKESESMRSLIVDEWAFKECISLYGKNCPTHLKEFPYEVYCAVEQYL